MRARKGWYWIGDTLHEENDPQFDVCLVVPMGHPKVRSLIATAPEMLEALEDALEFTEGQEDVTDGPDGQMQANAAMTLCTTLRDVIAKAKATGTAR